jgi:medium-chain acyl-[acyl-carrier-protein] hydrolase
VISSTTNYQGREVARAQFFIRPRPIDQPKARLFAFPYAGASAVAYHPWAAALGEEIELVSLQYPGRGRLNKLSTCTHLLDLVDEMVQTVLSFSDPTPFAFFGHSMGATVAFEAARRLRHRGEHLPTVLFVSARPAPQIPLSRNISLFVSDSDFLARLQRYGGMRPEILKSESIMAILVPLIRADLLALESWTYVADHPLNIPIVALAGTSDPEVPPLLVRPWHEHTLADFEFHMPVGGHFYFQDDLTQVISIIRRRLLGGK